MRSKPGWEMQMEIPEKMKQLFEKFFKVLKSIMGKRKFEASNHWKEEMLQLALENAKHSDQHGIFDGYDLAGYLNCYEEDLELHQLPKDNKIMKFHKFVIPDFTERVQVLQQQVCITGANLKMLSFENDGILAWMDAYDSIFWQEEKGYDFGSSYLKGLSGDVHLVNAITSCICYGDSMECKINASFAPDAKFYDAEVQRNLMNPIHVNEQKPIQDVFQEVFIAHSTESGQDASSFLEDTQLLDLLDDALEGFLFSSTICSSQHSEVCDLKPCTDEKDSKLMQMLDEVLKDFRPSLCHDVIPREVINAMEPTEVSDAMESSDLLILLEDLVSRGYVVQCLRSDGGGEYFSNEFSNFLKKHGIQRQFSCKYTPQQNGVAEHKNRHIAEVAHALMSEKNMPQCYWAEAASTGVYIMNRTPTAAVHGMTSEETFIGKKIDVSHFKVFGCISYVHVPDELRTKLDPKAEKCVLIGYLIEQKGYKCYNVVTHQVRVSKDVVFDEMATW
ncbi:hypothetical protein L7F22_059050 [Adiantum nelumboides]|nr:hypothetical protein [Adiantum nelumboides]